MRPLILLMLALASPALVSAQTAVAKEPVGGQANTQTPKELYQLPFEFRRTLPEIKITVRHAPEDPEERFVKINGERFAQGDNLELGPTIIEIRTDGVVLEYQGQLLIIR